MSSAPDPIEVAARIDDDLHAISARLSKVTGDVAELREALAGLATRPATAPEPEQLEPEQQAEPEPRAATEPQAEPRPTLQYATAFAPPPGTPIAPPPAAPPIPTPLVPPPYAGPQPAAPFPPYPGAPSPVHPYGPAWPAPPVRAPRDTGSVIGRVLAVAGAAITLIGVVLLLVLAAEAGLLRPEVRVAGGAVLAAVLAGAGIWVGRRPARRPAASALVATGVVTALFCVMAAANIYHWLPMIAALVLSGTVVAGGLGVAAAWKDQWLGVTAGVALILFSPFLTHGFTMTLAVFLLVYAAASLAVQIGRNWCALFAVTTVAATLPIVGLAVQLHAGTSTQFAIVACLTAALGVASACLLVRTSSLPLLVALIGLLPVLPLLISGYRLGGTTAGIILGVTAAVLLALAAGGTGLPGANRGVRIAWLAAGVVTGVIAVAVAFGVDGFTLALLGTAAVLAVSDRAAGDLALPVRIAATVVLAVGLVAIAVPGATAMFVRDGLGTTDRIVLVIGSLLALVALGMVTWSWLPSAKSASTVLIVIAGLVSLLVTNVFCVAVGTAVTGGSLNGYRAGQMCATIGFVAAGAVALTWARRLRHGDRTLALTAGLLVIAVAVAKLFLFDLAALGGFFRVLVFIVVGLVLLGLGVVYAQSLPEDDPSADCPTGPIPVLHGR
ncbi:DUF2339 domain-containing protein [Gordonia sp. PP30]|uniref:DUF2339 domain-containing protein n=1 Tax=Gordonia sp. PP30 TaxID=2935861 RepID=UPI001FFF2B5B|nr:DUF2339 domain-containing protein [Gordonia sp. PP30]UQE75438.1 DUF2339 domain-containing protein [Gordonia sp. PP30]